MSAGLGRQRRFILCSFTRSRLVGAIGYPRRNELTVWRHARRPRERLSKLFVCVASCNYRSMDPLTLDLDSRPACWTPVLTPCASRLPSAAHHPCCVSRPGHRCSPFDPSHAFLALHGHCSPISHHDSSFTHCRRLGTDPHSHRLPRSNFPRPTFDYSHLNQPCPSLDTLRPTSFPLLLLEIQLSHRSMPLSELPAYLSTRHCVLHCTPPSKRKMSLGCQLQMHTDKRLSRAPQEMNP